MSELGAEEYETKLFSMNDSEHGAGNQRRSLYLIAADKKSELPANASGEIIRLFERTLETFATAPEIQWNGNLHLEPDDPLLAVALNGLIEERAQLEGKEHSKKSSWQEWPVRHHQHCKSKNIEWPIQPDKTVAPNKWFNEALTEREREC